MKLKNLFTTLGLTLALGVGVGASVLGHKQVKKSEAISLADDMTFYYIDNWNLGTPYFYEFDGSDHKPVAWPGVAMNDTGKTFEYAEGQSAKVFSFTADAVTYDRFIINVGSNAQQTKNILWSWYAPYNGNAFLHVTDDGDSLSLTDYAEFAIEVDSVKTPLVRNWDNTEAAEYQLATDKAFDPAKPIAIERNGEAYAFTMKADIDNNYNNGEIVDSKIVVHNAATTNLYLNADTQQVWVGGFEFDAAQNFPIYLMAYGYGDMYLYSYEFGKTSKALGTFPGTKMTAFTGIAYSFAGNAYGIYKTVFPGESSDDTFIFNDNGGHEASIGRSDLATGDNTFNMNTGSKPSGRTGAFEALARLQELVEAIPANAVEETVQGSTCGVTKAYAQMVVDEMDTLTGSMPSWLFSELEASTIYLVSAKDGSAHANYTYVEIMNALQEVAVGSSRVMHKINKTNNSTTLLVVIISSVALVSIGGFFLLKKKREN